MEAGISDSGGFGTAAISSGPATMFNGLLNAPTESPNF